MKFAQKSNENLLFLVNWIQSIAIARLTILDKENNEKLTALERCFSFIGLPSDRSFYQLYGAARILFENPNPINSRWSNAALKGYMKIIELFQKVDHEIDDKYVNLYNIKEWIEALREFVYSDKGKEWIRKFQKL